MIKLNVGGKMFDTTKETLSKCHKFNEIIEQIQNNKEAGSIFLDRDPSVFGRLLKFLRGYPVKNIEEDQELICELIYWKHYFTDIGLCDCLQNCGKKYHQVQQIINTPFLNEIERYQKSHYLVPLKIATDLFKELAEVPNDKMPLLQVICSKDWNDHVWIDHETWKRKLNECKLKCALYNMKFCFCKVTHEVTH